MDMGDGEFNLRTAEEGQFRVQTVNTDEENWT